MREAGELLGHRGVDLGPSMAVEVGPQRGNSIEIAVAQHVDQGAALGALDDQRLFLEPALHLREGMPEAFEVLGFQVGLPLLGGGVAWCADGYRARAEHLGDGLGQTGDVFGGVVRRDAQPQARGALRNGRGTHGAHQEARLFQGRAGLHGRARGSDSNRHQLVLAADEREPGGLQRRCQPPGALGEPRPAVRTFRTLNHPQRRQGRPAGRRCRRGREDVAAGPVEEKLNQAPLSGDVGSESPQGFPERAHLDVDSPLHPELAAQPGPLAEDAGGVRFIDHQQGTVTLGQIGEAAERRRVPIHAEQTLGDDQLAAPGAVPQLLLELFEIEMAVDVSRCVGEPAAVDDRSVVELIREDRVPVREQGRQDPEVGLVAAVEEQSGLGALELRERFLELPMDGEVASQQPARARSPAELQRGHGRAPAHAPFVG